jgi:hypothetical protein
MAIMSDCLKKSSGAFRAEMKPWHALFYSYHLGSFVP